VKSFKFFNKEISKNVRILFVNNAVLFLPLWICHHHLLHQQVFVGTTLVVLIQRVVAQKHDAVCVFYGVSYGVYVCVWFLIHRDYVYVFYVCVFSSVFFFHNRPINRNHIIENTKYY